MSLDVRLLFPPFVIAVGLALALPAMAYVPDTPTVTFLDIGQGDAILVQASYEDPRATDHLRQEQARGRE